MKQSRFVLAVLGMLLVLTGSAFCSTNSISGDSFLPKTFKLSWVGAPNFSHHYLTWDGKSIIYDSSAGIGRTTETNNITPSKEAWLKFWQELEPTEIWKWQKFYETPGVLDGEVWKVQIEHGTNNVNASFRNAFPKDASPDTGDETESKIYLAYVKAVEKLIDRKLWK